MEEKEIQEETKAEYTGEYGNSVEGVYKMPDAPSAEYAQNTQPTDNNAGNLSVDNTVAGSNAENNSSLDGDAAGSLPLDSSTVNSSSSDSNAASNASLDSKAADSQSVDNSQNQAESSLYSYNYQNGNGESTHSGDYYADHSNARDNSTAAPSGENTGTTQSSSYDSQNTGAAQNSSYGNQNSGAAQNSSYDSQSTGAAQSSSYGSQSTGTSQNSSYGSQNTGTSQNSSYGSQSASNSYNSQSGNYSRQNQFYQDTNPYQNGGNSQMQAGNNEKPPKKNGSSLGMKILVTAVCAVLFGVIAGVCFQAVNLVTDRLIGQPQQQMEQLNKTTADNEQPNNASSDNSGKTIINNTVTDVSAITEQTMPALVAITSTTKGTDYYDLFGQYYPGQDATSCGTGIIVGQNDKELLIATNNHVIDGAKTISVQFIDGEVYEAMEKGSDSANDLAVVAVKAADVKKDTMSQLKIADLGNSDEAKVGEMVIAIGNALGYGQSLTVGWISAKDREITEASENGKPANKIKVIQTDAAINPGNSGGALINMQGQVIGINSAKIADSSVEGVGYAIPISVATPIIDDLMNREILDDSEKGYLGISCSTVSDEASAYNIPYGVHVQEVAKGGAAEKAGIMVNDIITAVNKMEVTTKESLQEKVNSYRKGTEVEITVQRSSNGKYTEKIIKVTLQGSESLDNLSNDNNNSSNNYNNRDYGNNGGNDNYGNGGNNGNNNGNGGNDYYNDYNDDNGSGSFWDYFFN